MKSPVLFRAKCRTQECIKRVNIILSGINFLATLRFICCCIAHLSSFIRSLLILSFLLQLLLLLIILCHRHICCLQSPFRPFIKTNSDRDPWGTQKLYFGHLEIWFTSLCLGFALCNSHIAQTRTYFIACCLTIAPRNHQSRGTDGSQRSALHMHHILPVLAMSKRNEAHKRGTNDAWQTPEKFWRRQIQSWGYSVAFAFVLPGSYY